MSIYDPGPSYLEHVETETAIDTGPAGVTRVTRWRGRPVVVDPKSRPLLTLMAGFLARLGLFTLVSSPLWLLPVTLIPAAERLGQPWVYASERTPVMIALPIAIGVGLALMWIGSNLNRVAAVCILWTVVVIPSFVAGVVQQDPTAYAALAVLIGLWAWGVALDAWLRRHHVDPDTVRFGLGTSGNRRAGIAALLLAALWVAAIRIGLPYRLHLRVDVNAAIWVAVSLMWLGALGVVWNVLRAPTPRRRVDPVDEFLARMKSAPPPKLAQPSLLEPARLADLVLPDRTLSDLRALIRLIADPEAARTAGIEPPAGAILYGPPGTGKTLIARAVAGESGRKVLAFSGATLSSKWVGESTERVHDMFRQAREAAPCVLVLDELDGIAPSREGDPSNSAAHRDFAQRINEILQQLEGVGGPMTGVFVVGATNHLDAIDAAVRSRLSYHISVPLPDEAGRAEILRRHFPQHADPTPEEIARLTAGFSGRDLREACRAASIARFGQERPTVTRADFEIALTRIATAPGAHGTRSAEPSRVAPASFTDLVLPAPTTAELQTFVRLLRDPDRAEALGVEPPAGAILYGPPGTGKTLIARAVAGELGRPVLAFSGASLTSVVVSEGAQLIRDTFRQAREQAPCVLFIDELDGITPSRQGSPLGFGMPASHDAVQQINQFLQELEGVGGSLLGVCVIGATNHLEAIDPAVRSRLSYHVEIPLPDHAARVAILRMNWPKQTEATPEDVADLADGLSGRDLRELCRGAGMIALSAEAHTVTLEHFRRARERIGASGG